MSDPGSDVSGWTLSTLYLHFTTQLRDLRDRLDERHTSQQKAVTDALASAEKAVNKSEASYAERFRATNEFRGQLADQARTLMPRIEAEQRIASQAALIQALTDRLTQFQLDTRSRLDVLAGTSQGAAEQKDQTRLSLGAVVAVVGVVVSVISVAVVILIAAR